MLLVFSAFYALKLEEEEVKNATFIGSFFVCLFVCLFVLNVGRGVLTDTPLDS